jgi:hypothetical protein
VRDEEVKRPPSHHTSEALSRAVSEHDMKMDAQDDDALSVHSTASMRSESRRANGLNGPINYPPSIKAADQRAEKVASSFDGKAFLMDIDTKFEGQDKMINHLLNQLNSVTVKLDSIHRNQRTLQESERDARMKLESNLKLNADESNFSASELMAKVSSLDEKLRREEQAKNELRERVLTAEANQKELMQFMSQTKKQDEAELRQLRGMLQELQSDEQVDKSKNNEKSAAMFQEVVRIGMEQEKVIENLQNLNSDLEAQMSTLESKISILEQNSNNLEQKGDVSNGMMGDLAEKIEKRLHNVEDVIQMLNSEQKHEKDKISHIEVNSLKNNEDFRDMLGHLQKDYGIKLEARMTELVSRLLGEQDERMKNVEDLRYTIDTKEKMINEKSKYEREEMRNRYAAMDAITKAEFQRHNEAIAGIQNNLEAQMKTISSWIKQEELNRTQLEVNMRMEVSKMTESVRGELEGFQRQQVQINEKITDMIRMETDARERSEDEKKSLIQNLIRGVTEEVVGIKEDTDHEIRKLTQEVKDIANDNAERSHFLSRYVDDEIYKVSEKVAKPIENLKALSTRLTEQFKKHLINHENIKKDIYKRFDFIEKHMPVYRSELYKLIEKSEGRMLIKMKELKDNVDNNLVSNFRVFDERMDQFSELVDNNLDTLRKAIIDNREMIVAMKNKFLEEITFTQDKVVELGAKVTKDSEMTKKGLLEMEAFVNTMIFNEKAARTAMTNQLAEEIDKSAKDYTKKIDDLATYAGDINAALESVTGDVGNLDTEQTNNYYEFLNYKDASENQIRDIVIRMTMEKMVNMLETYEVDVKTIPNRDKTMVGKINLTEKIPARTKPAKKSKDQGEDELNEMMDRKLDKVYERIRNDNWVIWKESIRLAEKEFSEGGIQKTIDLLPKVTYDRNDLKRQINTLMHEDAQQIPRPVIKTGKIKDSPKKQKPSSPPKQKPSSPPKKTSSQGDRGNKTPQSPNESDRKREYDDSD